MVKADSVDVNFAQINRMTPRAWQIAAQVFEKELAGIKLLTREQVRGAREALQGVFWWSGLGTVCSSRCHAILSDACCIECSLSLRLMLCTCKCMHTQAWRV